MATAPPPPRKWLLESPATAVRDAIDGFVAAHPGVNRLDGYPVRGPLPHHLSLPVLRELYVAYHHSTPTRAIYRK